jgi:HK97 gp10 family phage protein
MFSAKLEGMDVLLKELRDLGGNTKKSLRGASKAGGEVIRVEADKLAPDTRYKRKTVSKASFPNSPEVCEVSISPSKKAWFLRFFETGVTRHEIKAKKKASMAFEGSAGLVVTKSVNHPGMPARPFLRPAFDAKSAEATQVVGEAMRQAVEERRIAKAAEDEE